MLEHKIKSETGELICSSQACIDHAETAKAQAPIIKAFQSAKLAELKNQFIQDERDKFILENPDANQEEINAVPSQEKIDEYNPSLIGFTPPNDDLDPYIVYLNTPGMVSTQLPEHQDGKIPVFDQQSQDWVLIENNRGAVVYNLSTGERKVVDYLGAIEAGYTQNESDLPLPCELMCRSLSEIKDKKLKSAKAIYEKSMNYVLDPGNFSQQEQTGWAKQEKEAWRWKSQLDINGDPTEPMDDHKPLKKMAATKYWINKNDVTPAQMTERANAIIAKADILAPYYFAVTGALHHIEDLVEAINPDPDDQSAVNSAKLNVIDIDETDIEAIAYIELMEMQS